MTLLNGQDWPKKSHHSFFSGPHPSRQQRINGFPKIQIPFIPRVDNVKPRARQRTNKMAILLVLNGGWPCWSSSSTWTRTTQNRFQNSVPAARHIMMFAFGWMMVVVIVVVVYYYQCPSTLLLIPGHLILPFFIIISMPSGPIKGYSRISSGTGQGVGFMSTGIMILLIIIMIII